jgi:hypothetical protein
MYFFQIQTMNNLWIDNGTKYIMSAFNDNLMNKMALKSPL